MHGKHLYYKSIATEINILLHSDTHRDMNISIQCSEMSIITFQWPGNMIVIAYRTTAVRWNKHHFVAMRWLDEVTLLRFPMLVSYENYGRNCSFHLPIIENILVLCGRNTLENHDERIAYNVIFPSFIEAIIFLWYNNMSYNCRSFRESKCNLSLPSVSYTICSYIPKYQVDLHNIEII